MMRLPCPWCGECDEIEFVYGGPSALLRPALEASDETWGRYLYFRANVKAQSLERWRHATVAGSGSTLGATRRLIGCWRRSSLARSCPSLTSRAMSGFRLPAPSGSRLNRAVELSFTFDGRAHRAFSGDTIASALLASGERLAGRSFKLHRPARNFSCAWRNQTPSSM